MAQKEEAKAAATDTLDGASVSKELLQPDAVVASAPSARRSVSFGPASISPPNGLSSSSGGGATGGVTILDQANTFGGGMPGEAISAEGIGEAGSSSYARRVASGSSSSSTSMVGPASMPGSAGMTPSGSSMGLTTLKPALKQGTERKRLPPLGQYQHPDPLIRRLRLVDDAGKPVDLKQFFKGVKIVAFYFSSQWAGQPLKEYHTTVSEFAREHDREFKVVYVSVDVDEQWYKAGVKGQPWVSMVWNDGSSLPSPSMTNATSPSADQANDEPPALYNNEDFLLAQETDIDESLAKTDTAGEAYLRPFSRVHLASKLNIIAAPTVCVYNLERQKMLDWNVRMSRLHRSERDETWARWRKGESAKSFGFSEALANSPGTVALTIFALAYWILILAGGQEYNFLRRMFDSLDQSVSQTSVGSSGSGAAEALGKMAQEAREHIEF